MPHERAPNLFANFQRRMIFPGPEGVTPALLARLAKQLNAAELGIPTTDGETLYGWHRSATRTGPKRTLLYFHGNASSVLAQVELQNLLLGDGWDFVGVHYRGYPGSTGVPSEAGLHEDAKAAWRWTTETLGTAPTRVAVHGRSLGGGVAARLASTVGPGALILESTFTSIVDLAKEHYPFLPVSFLLDHRFMTRDLADRVGCPTLVAHGSADTLVDVHHGRELARLFHADEYIEAPRLDHQDMLFVGALASRYLRFLDRAVAPAT